MTGGVDDALAIVELARTLGLETVAEGVERPDQVAELVALGCGMAQGYHVARPLTPEAVDALLAATTRQGWVSVPRVPRAPRPALWSASHPSSPE